MKKKKNHMSWSWAIIIGFFVLGILDIRFGILGLVCMTAPLIHALKGHGKKHCQSYCPRGSFLGKFLERISLKKPLPKFMTTRKFKNALLIVMLTVFSFGLYHSGGNFHKLSMVLFRFMGMSFIVGILLGIFFKPRSWCVVCPMGHGTQIIKDIQTERSFIKT